MTLKLNIPVADTPTHNPLKEIWVDSLTIFWGEWLDLRVRVKQIIASGMVSPLIYILAFGLGLGNSLGKPTVGETYLEFMLPGMIALSSMTICFAGTTFSICGDRLFSKTFEELLLLPVHPLALYLGKVMAGVARGLLTSASIIVIAIFCTGKLVSFLNPLFFLVLLLNCAVFAGLGVLVGLKVQSIESVGLYNNFLIVPMSFLGGTFFDPNTLPGLFKIVTYGLPLTYASVGLRAAAYLPLHRFPWYTLPILVVMALVLSGIGAYQFSHQQD
ncbi:MAG: ABC transporter permease [Acaryochloris sp. RU_4_1]|nr:ABC transporter permease [Acaryochloris sp. RU_4_1]NJR55101.1 ABC transporter permease [Acaryochloris sp. CRU_2_0]